MKHKNLLGVGGVLVLVFALVGCTSSPLVRKNSLSLDLDREIRGKILFSASSKKWIYDPFEEELTDIYHGFPVLDFIPSRRGEMLYCYGDFRDQILDLYSILPDDPKNHRNLGTISFPTRNDLLDLFEERGSIIASSRSDSLLYATTDLIVWIDRRGNRGPVIIDKPFDQGIFRLISKLSRNEQLLIEMEISSDTYDIFLQDLVTGNRRLIRTFDARLFEVLDIALSPDGQKVAYVGNTVVNGSTFDGFPILKVFSIDNPNNDLDFPLPNVINQASSFSYLEWSPSGNKILFNHPKTRALRILNLENKDLIPVLQDEVEFAFEVVEYYWSDL